MKGVLDRVEDGIAVILVEETNEQFTIPVANLPTGSKEGMWFTLATKEDSYYIVAIDKQKTAAQTERINTLQQKL